MTPCTYRFAIHSLLLLMLLTLRLPLLSLLLLLRMSLLLWVLLLLWVFQLSHLPAHGEPFPSVTVLHFNSNVLYFTHTYAPDPSGSNDANELHPLSRCCQIHWSRFS